MAISPELEILMRDSYLKPGANYVNANNAATTPAVVPVDAAIEAKLQQRLLTGGDAPGHESSTSVVDLKPKWYQPLAPPTSSTGGALAQAGLGALAAGAQNMANVSAHTPGRHFGNVATDQNTATLAGLAANLAGAYFNKPKADYDEKQAAALKEAQMNKLTHDSRSGDQANELGYLSLQERRKEGDFARSKYEQAQKAAADQADVNSDATKQMREAAYATGTYEPGSLDSLTANGIKTFRTANMQRQGQDWRGSNQDRTMQNERSMKIEAENRTQADTAKKEQREDTRNAEANAIPGVKWIAGRPPPPKVADDARVLDQSRNILVNGSKRLAELQGQLKPLQAAFGSNWLVKGISDKEQQSLLAEADTLQKDMFNAYRNYAQFGVLSGKEGELANSAIGQPGTPQALLNGQADWAAMQKQFDHSGRQRMRSFGGVYEDDPEAANAKPSSMSGPVEGQINQREVPQFEPYQPQSAGAQRPMYDIKALGAKAAQENGIRPELLQAMFKQESAGDPNAVSPKGAMGVAQLMPETARSLGVTDPYDASQSIGAGAKHLGGLIKKYGEIGALQAYNMGEEAYNQAMRGHRPIPQETLDYVNRILPHGNPNPKPAQQAAAQQPAPGAQSAGAAPLERQSVPMAKVQQLQASGKWKVEIVGNNPDGTANIRVVKVGP